VARSALITGGTGGLGSAVTRTFLDAGWRVVVPLHDEAGRGRVPQHERLVLQQADLFDAGAAAAVLAFVDVLATEYRDDGIRANALLRSVIDTPANRAAMPDADHRRWVSPQRIAGVARFLCEDGSGVVSGAHVPV